MYPYTNEDEAWQRLKDLQREMENSRLTAASQPRVALDTFARLASRVWLLAGLATRRPPRKRPQPIRHDAA